MPYSGDELYGDKITSPTHRPLADFVSNNASRTFEQWMKEVDQIVSAATGMSIHDLPDMRFRDAYDDDDSPEGFCADNLGIEDGMLVDPDLFAEATDM